MNVFLCLKAWIFPLNLIGPYDFLSCPSVWNSIYFNNVISFFFLKTLGVTQQLYFLLFPSVQIPTHLSLCHCLLRIYDQLYTHDYDSYYFNMLWKPLPCF